MMGETKQPSPWPISPEVWTLARARLKAIALDRHTLPRMRASAKSLLKSIEAQTTRKESKR
jgi:hypothetical protein